MLSQEQCYKLLAWSAVVFASIVLVDAAFGAEVETTVTALDISPHVEGTYGFNPSTSNTQEGYTGVPAPLITITEDAGNSTITLEFFYYNQFYRTQATYENDLWDGTYPVTIWRTFELWPSQDWPTELVLAAPSNPDLLPPEEFSMPRILLPGDIDPRNGQKVPCGNMVVMFLADNQNWTTGERTGAYDFSRYGNWDVSWSSHSTVIMDENAKKLTSQAAIDQGLLSDAAIASLGSSAAAAANVNAMLGMIGEAPLGNPPGQAEVNQKFDDFGFPDCAGPDIDGDGNPDLVDTDGDGEPDASDSDIDGDGTLNHEDSDADGDGTINAYDDTPYGGGAGQGGDLDQDGNAIDDALQDEYGETGETWEPTLLDGFTGLDVIGEETIVTQDYTWGFAFDIPGVSPGESTFNVTSLPDTSTTHGQALDSLRILVRGFMTIFVVLFWTGITYKTLAWY